MMVRRHSLACSSTSMTSRRWKRLWPPTATCSVSRHIGGWRRCAQQAMLVRRYPVPDPVFRTPPGELPCTYLVAYEGSADHLPDLARPLHRGSSADHGAVSRHPTDRDIHPYRLVRRPALAARGAYAAQQGGVRQSGGTDRSAQFAGATRDARFVPRFPPFTGPITHFPMSTTTVMPVLCQSIRRSRLCSTWAPACRQPTRCRFPKHARSMRHGSG